MSPTQNYIERGNTQRTDEFIFKNLVIIKLGRTRNLNKNFSFNILFTIDEYTLNIHSINFP